MLKIQLIKSLNAKLKKQIACAQALGLKRINNIVYQPDNAATKGKIAKISHLVTVSKA